MKRTKEKTIIRDAVFKWSQKVGRSEALGRLILKRMSEHTAAKLVDGRYTSEPTGTNLTVIENELAKDGISTPWLIPQTA